MEKPVYQMICDNISDGVLARDFSLPEEGSDSAGPKFAPGALDGIIMYHTSRSGLSAEQTKKMARALHAAADGSFEEADRLFAEWTDVSRAISVVDELQNYVMAHAEKLNPGNVYQAACAMLHRSVNVECVKIGMELLELFKSVDDNTKEVIRRLGLYDEFTLFSVWDMMKWENGNEEIFNLAKKVYGWGRIHAVERLEPETDEIRRWLLMEGHRNDVMDAYTALTCWKKSQAESVLFGNPTAEEYENLSEIIEALLDEGPVAGISEIDNAEEVLLRFLEVTKTRDPDISDCRVVQSIKDWALNDDDSHPSHVALCDQILSSPSFKVNIKTTVIRGEDIDPEES